MGNYYSYMRISTKEERNKQSYARQEKALKNYAEQNNFEYLVEFQDDESGATFERTNWKRLEKLVQSQDTIVFKDISRFTRQANEGYNKYMELMNAGINLVFLDNPTVSTDYIKDLTKVAQTQDLVTKTALEGTIKLLLIVELDRVQKEREIFIQRVKQGIAASDKVSGRKQGQLDKLTNDIRTDIEKFLVDRTVKQIDLMQKHNISRNTLKKYIKIIQEEKDNKVGA